MIGKLLVGEKAVGKRFVREIEPVAGLIDMQRNQPGVIEQKKCAGEQDAKRHAIKGSFRKVCGPVGCRDSVHRVGVLMQISPESWK